MSRVTHDICDWLHVPHSAPNQLISRHAKPVGDAQSTDANVQTAGNGRRIILAGGSGYLGGLLKRHFEARGWEVLILTRTSAGHGFVHWDGLNPGPWTKFLEGADALINLAGRSVNCRYTARNRRALMDSRLGPTRALRAAVAACDTPPRVWMNASTATIYRHTFGPAWDETGEIGWDRAAKDEFSVKLASAWERAFDAAPIPRTRRVCLRSAMVLGRGNDPNNAFAAFRRLVRLGLGGRMGNGRQFVSWIHEDDFCRAMEFLIENEQLEGPVNLAAPDPRPNAEMMQLLRRHCGVSFGLPAALWMLEIGAFFLRTETELIIKSRRVVSSKLASAGFQFRYADMEQAIVNLLNQPQPT